MATGRRISEKNSVPDDAAVLVEKQLRAEETALSFHVPTREHQPEEETADLQFADMFNLTDVQAIQDAFANATGVASVIVDVNGTPITRPSNFSRLCAMIHATAQGAAHCRESDAAIGKRITESSIVHPCLSAGLWDGGSKIYVGNRHVASWLVGQVLDDQGDEERIVQYGRDIGVDEAEFREALRHVVRMPREQFERVCRALHLVAQQLSNLAFQNIRQKQEIARRVKAEKSLQESREQVRLFADASFEGISILEDGIIVDVNEQYLKMHQYTREELIGQPVLSIISPRSRQTVADAIRSDNLGPYQLWSCRKDGTAVLVEVRARILHVGNRKLRLSAVRDITERKRYEENLRQAKEDWERTFNTVPDLIAILDTNYRIIRVNRAMAQQLGVTPEQAVGLLCYECVHGTSRPPDYCPHARLLKDTGQHIAEVHEPHLGGDYVVSVTPLKNQQGEVVGSIHVARNVTEQKKAEEALRQAQKMESLGVLAGGIAHDFNNLLQVISGQISLALDRLPESFTGRSNMEKAQLAATRAADLTRQLLAYSGRGKFQIKVTELNAFIRDTLHLLEIAVPKNVSVRLEPAHLPLYFRADVAQAQQVLLNLVINGAEAMAGNPGTITIRTHYRFITEEEIPSWKHGDVAPRPGAFIVLDVEDTGQGMDQATMEKIFDPFFTTKFTGRGLGLSAVLGIIRGHAGGLKVESTLHVGTRFRIAFPQVASAADAPIEAMPVPADRAHGTILFIDDEEFLREMFVDAFDRSSIRVLTAKDGEEGIALFRQYQQDVSLIVLDLSMPGMGGEAAFRELRTISPHVKIILSSGYAGEDIMNKFKDLEVTGFIQKPYQWNRFDQLLNEHLRIS